MSAVAVLCAPQDEAFASHMIAALTREGYAAWRGGSGPYRGDLNLEDDAAIIVWSAAGLQSAALYEEARAALARGALIPVALAGAEPPEAFRQLPAVDLSGWNGDADDPRWRFVMEELAIAQRRPPYGDNALRVNKADTDNQQTEGQETKPLATLGAEAMTADQQDRSRGLPLWVVGLGAGASLAVIASLSLILATAGSPPPVGQIASLQASEPVEDSDPAPGPPVISEESEILRKAAVERLTAEPLLPEAAGEIDLSARAAGRQPALQPTFAAALAIEQEGPALLPQPALAQEQDSPAAAEPPAYPDSAALANLVAELTIERAPVDGDTDYFRDCGACPQMATIPAGMFSMGAADGRPEEGPAREIAIARDFAIAVRETTFDEWSACVADGGCGGYAPFDQGWGRGARPVVNVSYEDALAYAQWLSAKTGKTYRLPSEAEWEYAARAGAGGAFAFDGVLEITKANYDGAYPFGGEIAEGRGRTTPAASFQPNAFGLYDMHGNVWEWTADCWADDLSTHPADGAPRGGDCRVRALRGGAFNTGGWRLRSAHRIAKDQTAREFNKGFRVVRVE